MRACFRCRKAFTADDLILIVQRTPPGVHGPRIITSGMIVAIIQEYHERCLPPRLYHLFHGHAGSLPVGQSLPVSVPAERQHGTGEGLSRKHRRKRLPHRQRKLLAARKRQAQIDQQRADGEEWKRTTTAADVLARGGTLRLCHCRTFSQSDGYFISPHGYCGYCGKWTPEVYRAHLGEAALQAAIDELALHDRIKMRDLVATPTE